VVCTPKAASALQAVAGEDYLAGDGAQELAAQIVRLLDDETLRRVTGANGRQYVQQQHDWNRITQRLVEIYEDVHNSTGRRADSS
jgi:glycosyltransferase involved in cell wall biosynthesis